MIRKRSIYKNYYLLLMTIVIIAMLTSCQKKQQYSTPKLLESITFDDGNSYKFEYDDNDRLISITDYYNGEMWNCDPIYYDYDNGIFCGVTRMSGTRPQSWYKLENDIVSYYSTDTYEIEKLMTIDEDGYILTRRLSKYLNSHYEENYTYENGNLSIHSAAWVEENLGRGTSFSYVYDKGNSPILHIKSPIWFLQNYFAETYGLGLKNNPKLIEGEVYTYKYDTEGYPVERVTKNYKKEVTKITKFTYILAKSTDTKHIGGANNNAQSTEEIKPKNYEDHNEYIYDFDTTLSVGNGAKLLVLTGVGDGEGHWTEFGYDDQNRLNKITDTRLYVVDSITNIRYDSENIIYVEKIEQGYAPSITTFTKKKNKIYGDETIEITIDKDGQTKTFEWVQHGATDIYEYENKNLIKSAGGDAQYTTNTYTYDNKKSPFTNCTSPKWLIHYLCGNDFVSANNWVSYNSQIKNYDEGTNWDESHSVVFQYDTDDFPTQRDHGDYFYYYEYYKQEE